MKWCRRCIQLTHQITFQLRITSLGGRRILLLKLMQRPHFLMILWSGLLGRMKGKNRIFLDLMMKTKVKENCNLNRTLMSKIIIRSSLHKVIAFKKSLCLPMYLFKNWSCWCLYQHCQYQYIPCWLLSLPISVYSLLISI